MDSTRGEMTEEPFLVTSRNREHSHGKRHKSLTDRVIAGAVIGSLLGLIIPITIMIMAIVPLIIGVRYSDPRYCPIEPRISLFLIVHGSFGLAYSTIEILLCIIILCNKRQRSTSFTTFIVFVSIFLYFGAIFICAWLIVGSIWTFRVNNQVTHKYDTLHNFYTYDYCHPVLYGFTFVYLIISYVLLSILCCTKACHAQ